MHPFTPVSQHLTQQELHQQLSFSAPAECIEALQVPQVLKDHASNTAQLLALDEERVTLVVGPDNTKIKCHKLLLAYYSDFFQASLFGDFEEAHTGEIALPEESVEDVTAFVGWLYTGVIVNSYRTLAKRLQLDREVVQGIIDARKDEDEIIGPVRLWVFGDKFLSPHFSNTAMRLAMTNYAAGMCLEAQDAEYAYENTLDDSLIRNFIKDLITTEGPFNENVLDFDSDFFNRWIVLLAKGGDLVKECCVTGFKEWSKITDRPWAKHNHEKYFHKVENVNVREWHERLGGNPNGRN
ncbi:hypothetical protein HYFRA_00006421 [Hymenoscyphus fraxineus]|uniref:BTB domain-containing protein n=1 Tax=Hymenoscyphus fraxineus TaxID=746836 RepID=A0A9N9KPC2_9HELO|nr:hypothetical protein HYFRA_00006421 [Hymenoscyphus fraxineus]